MVKTRAELLKTVIRAIMSVNSEIKKIANRYIICMLGGVDNIEEIEISDFKGHYCIIVRYAGSNEPDDYIINKGLSTSKGKYLFQAMALTPRSPVYKKFQELLENTYVKKTNKTIT